MVQKRRARLVDSHSALLALPDVLLDAIFSWSVDSCSANALLHTCHHLHRLRTDPSAMALLVVQRDACGHPTMSLSRSYADNGVLDHAVMQAIITLSQAPGRSASEHLLHWLFVAAAQGSDMCALKQLLTLPGAAGVCRTFPGILYMCIELGHLACVQCLLEAGMQLREPRCANVLYSAAINCAAAVPLLLDRLPAPLMQQVLLSAFTEAVVGDNMEAVTVLLDCVSSSDDIYEFFIIVVIKGLPDALRLLIGHRCSTLRSISIGLRMAAFMRRVDCAALMIEAGADMNSAAGYDFTLLELAMFSQPADGPPPSVIENVRDGPVPMMQLLLHHGAEVTEFALLAAQRGGNADVQRLLRDDLA